MSRLPALLVGFMLAACTVGEGLDSVGDDSQGGADAAPGTPTADAGDNGNPGGPDAGIGPDAAPTPQSVLEAFGDCMSLADFQAENLVALASITTPEGICADCHAAGQSGNYMSLNETDMFNAIKTYPYILKYATTDADLNPIVSEAIPNQQDAGGGHPIFTLPPELAQGIIDFFDLTNARYQAGECAQAAYPAP